MNNRILYIDLLRFLAAFAVVMLHISSMVYGNADVGSVEYWVGMGYNVPTRWAVPAFVMVSGVLFLNPQKEISIKILYGKYLLKLLVVYLVWTTLFTYLLIPSMYWYKGIYPKPRGFFFLNDFSFHLWFLPMLMGVYVMTPILKIIAANEKELNYFLVLWLVFAALSIIPGCVADVVSLFHVRLVLGYTGYYLLGYKLSTTSFMTGKKNRMLFFFICSLALMYGMMVLKPDAFLFLDPLSPNVILFSTSVFLLFKCLNDGIEKVVFLKRVLAFCQNGLLGVYLIHPFFVILLYRPHFIAHLAPVVSIPLFSVIVFLISLITIKLLRKIPGIRYVCS